MKRFLALVLLGFVLFSLCACESKKINASNNDLKNNETLNNTITLSETKIELSVGEIKPLLIKVSGNFNENDIIWESTDENIAKYFDGEIIGKNIGSCKITATGPNGIKETCEIIVKSKIIDSGKCGENVTWTYYENFTLHISGKGEMDEYFVAYQFSNPANKGKSLPWNKYARFVKEVIIDEGVTSICRYAFYNMGNCKITIPSTVERIGYRAFYHSQFNGLVIPETVKSLGAGAFGDCENNVYYKSTEEAFEKILETETVDGQELKWYAGFRGKLLYYSETEKENSWHYVDEVPTPW